MIKGTQKLLLGAYDVRPVVNARGGTHICIPPIQLQYAYSVVSDTHTCGCATRKCTSTKLPHRCSVTYTN